jgi:hypothetical protein
LTFAFLGIFFVGLELMYRNAVRKSGGVFQMQLSSLFLWIVVVAFNCSVVRVLAIGINRHSEDVTLETIVLAFILWAFMILFSIPFFLMLGEQLLWLGVWFVKLESIRSWTQRWRSPQSSRDERIE